MTQELEAKCTVIKEAYPDADSALLPILHVLQDHYGHLTPDAIQEAADLMGMTAASVEGVVSFYTLYRKHPAGKYNIQICDNLSCAMRGAKDLCHHLEEHHGIKEGEVTEDGLFSLEKVECLAACGYAPAAQVNLRYYYDLTPAKLDKLIAGFKAGEAAVGERV